MKIKTGCLEQVLFFFLFKKTQTISVKMTNFNAVQDFTEATLMPEATKSPGLKWL